MCGLWCPCLALMAAREAEAAPSSGASQGMLIFVFPPSPLLAAHLHRGSF